MRGSEFSGRGGRPDQAGPSASRRTDQPVENVTNPAAQRVLRPGQRPDGSQSVPHISDVRGSGQGRQVPDVNLPAVRQPAVGGEIVQGSIMTRYEGARTLYSDKQGQKIDAVLLKEHTPDRITALAFPDAANGRPVTVVDLEGTLAVDFAATLEQEGLPLMEVTVTTAPGGVFSYLSPGVHAKAAAAYGEYETPHDAKYAEGLAADIAVKLVQTRAERLGADPATLRLTTKEIYEGYQVVRGAVQRSDDVSLDWQEIDALRKANLIAAPDKATRANAMDSLDRGLRQLIRRSEFLSSETGFGYTLTNAGPGQQVNTVIFTTGFPVNDIDDTEALKRVLAKAAPGIAMDQGGHVIVTDTQMLGNKFASMFPHGAVDLIFDPTDPRFDEVIDMIGRRGGFYCGPITDGPLAEKLAIKFGTEEKIEPTSVTLSGSLGTGTHDDSSYNKGSGAGASKTAGGSMGNNSSTGVNASVTTGKVQVPVVRGEDLGLIQPWEGFVRAGAFKALVTVENDQERTRLPRTELVTPRVQAIINTAEELSARAAEAAALTAAERMKALKAETPSPSTLFDDLQPHGAPMYVKHRTSQYKDHATGRRITPIRWMVETKEGRAFMAGRGRDLLSRTKEGNKLVKGYDRYMREQERAAAQRRPQTEAPASPPGSVARLQDVQGTVLKRAGAWLGLVDDGTAHEPQNPVPEQRKPSTFDEAMSEAEDRRRSPEYRLRVQERIEVLRLRGSAATPKELAELRHWESWMRSAREGDHYPPQR